MREPHEPFTVKIADIQTMRGFDLVVIYDHRAKANPLKVYKRWYTLSGAEEPRGWHRKKVNEFDNMVATMQYMTLIVAGQIVV